MKHGPLTFEYSKITPYIYIGTNMCCQGHFEKSLVKQGIKADISLENDGLDTPWGVDFFLWIPTRNHQAPTQKQLLLAVNTLKRLEESKTKVYVHCERGHGRAPTLVAAYLAAVKGITVEQAVSFVKKKRPAVHPNKRQREAITKALPFLRTLNER